MNKIILSNLMMKPRKTLLEVIDSKHIPEPNSGCWIWIGAVDQGYGKISISYPKQKCLLAHRASYEVFNGPIPTGFLVCHKCDNTYCVNPDHLFLGTFRDNVIDRITKKRVVSPRKAIV